MQTKLTYLVVLEGTSLLVYTKCLSTLYSIMLLTNSIITVTAFYVTKSMGHEIAVGRNLVVAVAF